MGRLSLIDLNYPVIQANNFETLLKDEQLQVHLPFYTKLTKDSCKFYTGLTLTIFFSLIKGLSSFKSSTVKICLEDQILLVLMRLRLGLLFGDLGLK